MLDKEMFLYSVFVQPWPFVVGEEQKDAIH